MAACILPYLVIKQKLMDRGVAEDVAEQQLSTEVQLVAPSCSRQTC